jgi:hypothetical protein
MNDLVRWNDFHGIFESIFPTTVRDVMDNGHVAMVIYSGFEFQIRPRPGLPANFDVWGPPAIELKRRAA